MQGLLISQIIPTDQSEAFVSTIDQSETLLMNFYSIRFVDVIHTDSKGFYKGGLGMEQAVGHVDFYPNGGKVVTCM